MSGRFISPARTTGTGVPEVSAVELAASQTFIRGALVFVNGSGLLEECSADPGTVKGIALADANTAPGEQAANNPLVITGLVNAVSVATANPSTIFSCRGVNGGTDPVTPSLGNIGVQYGAVKTGDGTWALDLADTSNVVFVVVDIDIEQKVFFVKFIPAVAQA
jgi:hypothetical protein